MKTMIMRLCGLVLGALLLVNARAAALSLESARNESLRHEVLHAISTGAEWLVKNQQPDGSWSSADTPAISALALVALNRAPDVKPPASVLEKGYSYLTNSIHEDGAIYRKKEMVNYNTSVGLLALVAAHKAEFTPLILKTRAYLVGTQIDLNEKGKLDSPFDGGVGYGSNNSDHSDLANTVQALEALYYSKPFVRDSKTPQPELNWQAAIHFLQNCQQLPAYNKESWVSDDAQNRGGFVYYPGKSMAGETNLPSGRVALRSYGSISYSGLLSYIYAELPKSDARVQAVLEWLGRNYTLEENPGMGPQGIYYYLQAMAKALHAADIPMFTTADGKRHPWAQEVALKLMNLQKPDGSWVNDNARWREKDAALVTAYGVITLSICAQEL